jgi:hypothetical protein
MNALDLDPRLDLIAHDHGYKLGLAGDVFDSARQNPFSDALLAPGLRNDPRASYYSRRWAEGLREGYGASERLSPTERAAVQIPCAARLIASITVNQQSNF